MADSFEDLLAQEAAQIDSTPSDAGLARLRKKGQEMLEMDQRIKTLENELKEANVAYWDVRTKDMPDLMAEIGLSSFTLSDGTEVRVDPYYKANISADWPEDKREASFAHLDDLGAGDIIKTVVTVSFGRGMADELQEWLEKVRGLNFSFDPPPLEMGRSVPWNTLTAFVKEQVTRGKGDKLDLELLGATVATIAKIVPPKGK